MYVIAFIDAEAVEQGHRGASLRKTSQFSRLVVQGACNGIFRRVQGVVSGNYRGSLFQVGVIDTVAPFVLSALSFVGRVRNWSREAQRRGDDGMRRQETTETIGGRWIGRCGGSPVFYCRGTNNSCHASASSNRVFRFTSQQKVASTASRTLFASKDIIA
jgi:hypothetical protein